MTNGTQAGEPQRSRPWLLVLLFTLLIVTIVAPQFGRKRPKFNDVDLERLVKRSQKFPPPTLYFEDSDVTDAGLVFLRQMPALTNLGLDNTRVTDAGLIHIKTLKELKGLFLAGTQVTDEGLNHLQVLTHLEMLDLKDTKVTDEGVSQLKKALPKCQIFH